MASGNAPTCFSCRPNKFATSTATTTPMSGAGRRADHRADSMAAAITITPRTRGAAWTSPRRPSTRNNCVSGAAGGACPWRTHSEDGVELRDHHHPADAAGKSGDHRLRNLLDIAAKPQEAEQQHEKGRHDTNLRGPRDALLTDREGDEGNRRAGSSPDQNRIAAERAP